MTELQEPKLRGVKATVKTAGISKRTFKKKNGETYEGDIWYIRYQTINSKGKSKTVTESCGKFTNGKLTTKKDAQDLLRTRQAEALAIKHPEDVPLAVLTFKEFVVKHYLKDKDVLKLSGLKEHKQVLGELCDGIEEVEPTEEEDKRKIHNPKAIGKYLFREITAKKMLEYIVEKENRGNEDSTLNRHLAAVKKVVRIAFEKGYAPHFTVIELKKIPTRTENNSRINYLRLSQIPLFLAECEKKSTYLRQIVEFALACGIRKNRVYKLEWNMIDMEHAQIRIPQDKHGDRFQAPLGQKAMKVLTERQQARKAGVPFVFFNEKTDKRWLDLRGSFDDAVQNAVKEAISQRIDTSGLDTFVFHDCRHTFISHLVMAGVPISHVKDLAGHRTLAMTMRYAHLDPKTLSAGVAQLPY